MITETDLYKRYTCDGANVTFPITFAYLDDSQYVQVWLYDTSLGDSTQLTETTDYTVSADTVTTVAIYAAKYDVILYLDFDGAITQGAHWEDNDPFTAASWEAALDKLTVINQWLAEQVSRCVKAPWADADGLTWAIDEAVSRADGWLHFDATTGQIEVVAVFSPSTATVSSFAETLLDDVSASAFLNTLGITAFAQTMLDDTSASSVLSTLDVTPFAQTMLDDASAAAVLTTLGFSSFIQTLLDDADAVTARATLGVATKGHLYGLTLSNAAGDPVNDILIAAGEVVDNSDGHLMVGTPITKRLDAAWRVGSDSGGLDTGAIANATYHVWLIKRTDTGVVDALFSLSATAPTMPAGYTKKRRIGAIIRSGATIRLFDQRGDRFVLRALVQDRALAVLPNTGRNATTLSVPPNVVAIIEVIDNLAGAASYWIRPTSFTDAAAGGGNRTAVVQNYGAYEMQIEVDANSQITWRGDTATIELEFSTAGWIDTRGKG